jgi:cephalosporin hydroxylase
VISWLSSFAGTWTRKACAEIMRARHEISSPWSTSEVRAGRTVRSPQHSHDQKSRVHMTELPDDDRQPEADSERGQQTSHGEYVPDAEEYAAERVGWREALASDGALREQAVMLQVAADRHRYTYVWEWAGVPIIRLPDDIVVAQELFWAYRPQRVVETGVARGGSMLLDASLMTMSGEEPAVLGIDHKLYPHTTEVLAGHPLGAGVRLLEADSTSDAAVAAAREFIGDSERAVLILDSNHTHDHVLRELRALAPLLPQGGLVMVADTLVEEFPEGHYAGRPWGRGNNPMTAVRAFLDENAEFAPATEWGRRALVSEFRDGILRRLTAD